MTVWLEIEGKRVRVELPSPVDAGTTEWAGVCLVDGRAVSADVRLLEPGVLSLLIADTNSHGQQYRCVLDGDGVVIGGRRYGFAVDDPRSLAGRRGSCCQVTFNSRAARIACSSR